MLKILFILLSIPSLIYSKIYIDNYGINELEILSIKDKEMKVIAKSPSLVIKGTAHFINNRYILPYSNLESKINCRLFIEVMSEYLNVESDSCKQFEGQYNLIEN